MRKYFERFMQITSIIIAVVIFILSMKSHLSPPRSISFIGIDKFLHILAFGCLAFTGSFWVSPNSWARRPYFYALLVFSIVACYGITDEVHQYFVPNRSSSVYDWLADCIGAGLALYVRSLSLKKVWGLSMVVSSEGFK